MSVTFIEHTVAMLVGVLYHMRMRCPIMRMGNKVLVFMTMMYDQRVTDNEDGSQNH